MDTNKENKETISHLSKNEKLVWLMDQYGDMVIRLAYTYVKKKEAAEDISQEVFVSCYKHLDEFKENASYKTWIYRITVNKCKDVLKSWHFRNIFNKDTTKLLSPIPVKESVERNEDIFNKVLALPVKYREVIILYYYEDISIREISDLLGVKSNTVKTRLHRGRNALKITLDEVKMHESF
ncbi:sigma-70 family RNA polymerase sigma factor [Niallia sp. 01092]|uniref:sigma-70 family RNA polymerase sigma factor n=1 Tax=unclassified Niallia TaxID=2837522 RepID=UPI003FD3C8D0